MSYVAMQDRHHEQTRSTQHVPPPLSRPIVFPEQNLAPPPTSGLREVVSAEGRAGRDNRQLTVFIGPSQASWDPLITLTQRQQQGWAQHRPHSTASQQQQQQQQQGEAPQQQGAAIGERGGACTATTVAAAATALLGTEAAV